jgi:Glypican
VVVEPINIKISEAIMNFQENGYQVSEKVFAGCGKPRLGKRTAVAADAKEIHYETLNFGKNGGGGRGRNQPMTELTPLEKLINDTLYKVRDTKNFWALLPLQMCNNDTIAASPKQDNNCWNGHTKAK